MQNQNDNILQGKVSIKETIHYKGELRIIGTIRTDAYTDKESNVIGYLIMDERRCSFKAYTVAQTKMLLQRIKFVNVVYDLESDLIVNTECSMRSLPVYNSNMRVISFSRKEFLTILGKIKFSDDNIKVNSFKVLNSKLIIKDLTDKEIINLCNAGASLVNAKIVPKNGIKFISAIKGEFTTITKEVIRTGISNGITNNINTVKTEENTKQEEVNEPKEKTPERKYIEERHKDKLKRWLEVVLYKSLAISKQGASYRKIKWFSNKQLCIKSKTVDNAIDFKKEIEIIIKEVLPEFIRTEKDKKILADIFKKLNVQSTLSRNYIHNNRLINVEDDNMVLSVALAQFLLNNPAFTVDKFGRLTHIRNEFDTRMLEKLDSLGLASDAYRDLVNKNKEIRARYYRNAYKHYDAFTDEMLKFDSEYKCNQIGFTLSEDRSNFKFKTMFGNNYELRYLGNYFVSIDNSDDFGDYMKSKKEFNKYLSMISCLGDILILAEIQKLITVSYFDLTEKRTRLEIMLAILALYRPDIVKEYLKNNEDKLIAEQLIVKDILPGLDLNNLVDFKLSPELKIYYASGFNVFLNDSGYNRYSEGDNSAFSSRKKYRKARYKTAKYINYRTLALGNACEHPMLYEELGSIVNLVTSDNVTTELINKTIGRLRII